MKTPRTPEGRVSLVANGTAINIAYCKPPGEALDAFRADLKDLVERPTVDAYMAACRANHWRNAQLRAHGIEPLDLTKVADLTHYPPEGYDFGAGGHVEAAFREGWRVNAIPADDPATSPEYLNGCETADWLASEARKGLPAAGEVIAWRFELARAIDHSTTPPTYCDWGPPQLSFREPCVPPGSIRNLVALRAAE